MINQPSAYKVVITRRDAYDLSMRKVIFCRDVERVRDVLRECLRADVKCQAYRREKTHCRHHWAWKKVAITL